MNYGFLEVQILIFSVLILFTMNTKMKPIQNIYFCIFEWSDPQKLMFKVLYDGVLNDAGLCLQV